MDSTTARASRPLLRALGSLWLAVVLLMLILVAMGSATAYESIHGTERAQVVFYNAGWFKLLLALLGLNLLAAMLARFPFKRRQVGFVLTHVSILLILIGAWITKKWGIDGQVSIPEGQTVAAFQVRQECLTIDRGDSRPGVSLEFDPAVTHALRGVDLPASSSLTLDTLHATVERYLPDSEERTLVLNDDPHERIAVEVVAVARPEGTKADGAKPAEMKQWVFADASENTGGVAMRLRPVDSVQELTRLLAPPPASQPASNGTVKIEQQGKTYEFPLERCSSQPAPVGDTGYSFRVLRYLPHAIVGQDHQITNASSQPVNPAIEVEITGPKGTSKQLAFAKFPDFDSMHGSSQQDLKVRFAVSGENQPPVPAEIYAARSGELGVRFTPEDGKPATKMITLGQAVETPWPGITFAVRQRYDHARVDHEVVPIEPAREEGIPAVQVAAKLPQRTERFWLRKDDSRPVKADGATYRVTFADKTQPLGFNIRLERFQVGHYPGTQRPRSFESQVTISDPSAGRQQSQVISMNRPVSHGAYTLYQSSYRQQPGSKSVTILSVSWDPGQPVVFIGYIVMLVGMVWVLALRLMDRRRQRTDGEDASSRRGGVTGT